MIKEVDGNLLTYPGLQVIGHQTNCLGIMGAGIAKQIKAKNPVLFKKYQWLCKDMPDKHLLLGTIEFIKTDDGKQYVANLFGQYSISETKAPFNDNGKPRQTDYDALKECFKKLHSWMVLKGIKTVGVPNLIGCGLAGGSKTIVRQLIEDEFGDDEDITFYIVTYKS